MNNPGSDQPPNYPPDVYAPSSHHLYNPYDQNLPPPPPQLPHTPLPSTGYGQSNLPPSSDYDPTVLSPSSPQYRPPVTPSHPGFPPVYPYQQPPPSPQPPPQHSPLSKILLVGLALLVILGGAGTVLTINHYNQVALGNKNATATAETDKTQAAATAKTQSAATARAQATATFVASHYPFSSNLVLDDPLLDNSKGNEWEVKIRSDNKAACQFVAGNYHVFELDTQYFYNCLGKNTSFSNFTYQVQMVITRGDAGGITFRLNRSGGKNIGYLALISAQGFFSLSSLNKDGLKTLNSGSSSAIKKGLDEINSVAIVARGNMFELYVNEQPVAKVSDIAYSEGQIGVVAWPFSNDGHPTEVAYSNVKVWKL